jgi:two-component system, NarL family, sensor kinase
MSNRAEEIILILATTSVIAIMLIFYFFILSALKKKQISYSKNLRIIQVEHEKEILQSQLVIQESTFYKISQEIHDNISLTLTLAKLNVNTFMMGRTHLKFDLLNSAVDLIGRSLLDLNNISKSLDSDIIGKNGLTRALEMELEKLNHAEQCLFTMDVNGDHVKLKDESELMLFRIIQESSNNILKHSGAQHAIIRLEYSDQYLEIQIRDDGLGFNLKEMEDRMAEDPRSGLRNIRNRARMLKGEATVTSEIGKGTNIHIKIPLSHEQTTR